MFKALTFFFILLVCPYQEKKNKKERKLSHKNNIKLKEINKQIFHLHQTWDHLHPPQYHILKTPKFLDYCWSVPTSIACPVSSLRQGLEASPSSYSPMNSIYSTKETFFLMGLKANMKDYLYAKNISEWVEFPPV